MNIEKKRKQVELAKVSAAKDELELVIMERLSDIERLKGNIENQENRIKQLIEEIKKMED